MTPSPPSAWLLPLPGGPPLGPIEVRPSAAGTLLGRDPHCDVRLPEGAGRVSRRHARLTRRDAAWHVADLGSSWGTTLNGVRLAPHRDLPLANGDVLGIAPWTFAFRCGLAADDPARAADAALADALTLTRLHTVGPEPAAALGRDLLRLLIEAASAVHAAPDEPAVARALADLAARGTGLPNAAVLRPTDAAGGVDVAASVGFEAPPGAVRRGSGGGPPATPTFSTSLLAAAARGEVASLTAEERPGGGGPAAAAESVLRLDIHTALCAPLTAGGAVVAYLYVDGRGRPPGHGGGGGGGGGGSGTGADALPPHAADFCAALGKVGGLAVANLRRADVERRAARAEADLRAAAVVQQWALPRGPTRGGPFTCVGRCRPCEFLGGDFFHAFALPGDRLAVAIGDASGHDPAAAVLTTVALGFLHAALAADPDPSAAVAGLNAFLRDRRPGDKFLTLWVGVFTPADPAAGSATAAGTGGMTLRYVDAGHGHARLVRPDGTAEPLVAEGGPAVGASPDEPFPAAAVPLPPGGRVVLYSDGLVEQPGPPTPPSTAPSSAAPPSAADRPASPGDRFGAARLAPLLAAADPAGLLDGLFDAVTRFAGTEALADDATAVVVHWA